MKNVLFLLFFGCCLSYAQDRTIQSPTAQGCGPAQVKFEVMTVKTPPEPAPLESGKAFIYVIQDDSQFDSKPRPTTRIGADGTWIGATRSNSYFRASVDPGDHHLCASWQGFVGFNMGLKMAALHFTAQPGKAYYFRVKDWAPSTGHVRSRKGDIEFVALDNDEGQLLASKFAFSSSHPKN